MCSAPAAARAHERASKAAAAEEQARREAQLEQDAESLEMEPSEDATVSLGMVEPVVDEMLSCRGFAVVLAYVLSLPAHKYGVADRPESVLDWDRKAWSLATNWTMHLDPGNVVLACCMQALMCRAGAIVAWSRSSTTPRLQPQTA